MLMRKQLSWPENLSSARMKTCTSFIQSMKGIGRLGNCQISTSAIETEKNMLVIVSQEKIISSIALIQDPMEIKTKIRVMMNLMY